MKRRFWSDEDRRKLVELYPFRPTAEVARVLERGISGVYGMAAKLGLEKSAEFLDSEESGRLRKGMSRPESVSSQFRKGSVPHNKGVRRPGWHAGRMQETQFKAGERSGIAAKNWKPVGTILPDSEGYLRIKVREAVHGAEATGFGNTKVWPLLGRRVWEEHNGPIPPKHIVAFRDKNRQNCAIENLELMSLADNARRNTMWGRYPRELSEAIQALGALNRKLRAGNGEK